MARTDLTKMLNNVSAVSSPSADPSKSSDEKTITSARRELQGSTTPPERSSRDAVGQAGDGPMFLKLTRKETRIREDQYAALTFHSRRLQAAKGTGGPRITENTLLRVAVDLLLLVPDAIKGSTEEEIRESVTSKFRK